jgi:hypothetical protein
VQGIQLDPDRAISLALIVNELVTNAVKHALSDRSDGHIWVRLARRDKNTALISVRDNGVGLPAGFDLGKSRGLGMRIVAGLSKQLGAAISHPRDLDGTEFILMVPLQRANE